MVYDRGAPSDYDGWRQLGNAGWSYDDVLPYFKRAEAHELGGDDYHGEAGPLRVSRATIRSPMARAWLAAAIDAGYPFNEDINGERSDGFGPNESTISQGRRVSTAAAYLRAARRRPNLTIITGAFANRILFEGVRATGVEYRRRGQLTQVKGDTIILSSGVFQSPQLLMLSGIGDGDHLRDVGIRTIVDLPGVGLNYHDHVGFAVQVASPRPDSNSIYVGAAGSLRAIGAYLSGRGGPLALPPWEAVGVFSSGIPGAEGGDFKSLFLPLMIEATSGAALREHGATNHMSLLCPESRGTIRLRSVNADDPPIIDARYLSAEVDRLRMREALKVARRIFDQQSYQPYRGRDVFPDHDVKTDAEIDAYIRRTAASTYHGVGSCRMGSDTFAVVDDRLRVRGTEGLYVVDASVMPRVVSGNTNAPTIMIAEKAADMIRSLPALPAGALSAGSV